MTRARPGDAPTLVIGVGTEHRHDDRCGLDVVRALHREVGSAIRVAEASADATQLLDLWEAEADVHVVDGVRSSAPPGTYRVHERVGELGVLGGSTSTHGLSLSDAIALGRTLGRFPVRLTVHTIEIDDVSVGDGLTPPVAAAVELLVKELAEKLGSADAAGAGPRRGERRA